MNRHAILSITVIGAALLIAAGLAISGWYGAPGSEAATLRQHTRALQSDSVRFELAPFESLEYKYRLEEDMALLYSWEATAPVAYDFHGEREPAGGGESFDQDRAQRGRGEYLAAFTGIHGWFWENRSGETVTVTLTAASFAEEAVEFRDGHVRTRPLGAAQPND